MSLLSACSSFRYFASIVAVFRSGKSIDKAPEFIQILAAVIPKSNKSLVQSQFSFLCDTILGVLRAYGDDIDVLRPCLGALGELSLMQEASDGFWGKSDSFRVINAQLMFIDDARPALRKDCVLQVRALLQLHQTRRCRTVRSYVADFCCEVFRTCTRSGYKRSLFVMLFLESALSHFIEALKTLVYIEF